MSSLRPDDLSRPVTRLNKEGIRRTKIVRDVLIHVVTEELHHRGEIIAILWQMNFQPPDMGWLSVMKKTRSHMGIVVRNIIKSEKLDLITNTTVIDDAIRFISRYHKNTTNMSSASN